MKRSLLLTLTAATAFALPFGCSTAPESQSDRATLTSEVDSSLANFRNADPSLQDLLNRSVGYAVFPDVGKAGFIVGGAYGRGQVFDHGARVGYSDISQGSVGFQAGAETFDEMIVFLTPAKLNEFKSGKFAFSANVSAVAIKSGAAAAADYSKGVVVFSRTKGGLMAEASVGGQNFSYVPF